MEVLEGSNGSDRRASNDAVVDVDVPLLRKWRTVSRDNKRLHEASRSYYKGLSDHTLILTTILGGLSSLLQIVFGFYTVNGLAQVILGGVSFVNGVFIAVAAQLEWDKKHVVHEEYSARYGEVVRHINAETTLQRMGAGTYASLSEFIKVVHDEIDKIESTAPSVPGRVQKKLGLKPFRGNGD